MNDKSQLLLEEMLRLPPDSGRLRALLDREKLSSIELAKAAMHFIDEDCWVHLWFVLIGYGGRLPNNVSPVRMKNGASPEILRRHERFDWEIKAAPETDDGWLMHIFDRETGAIIAEL